MLSNKTSQLPTTDFHSTLSKFETRQVITRHDRIGLFQGRGREPGIGDI